MRAEMLLDVFRTAHTALYGGAGAAVHYLTFSSNGNKSGFDTFKSNANRITPSFAFGGRAFTARKPYTAYGEVRYGRAFGKTDERVPGQPWLTEQTFEFTGVNAVSFEGGLGLHW